MPKSANSGPNNAAAEHDHQNRAKACAGGDADEAGIGQRVAEQALHDRAGDGERGADQEAEDGARQADIEDDDAVAGAQRLFRAVHAEKPAQDVARARHRQHLS